MQAWNTGSHWLQRRRLLFLAAAAATDTAKIAIAVPQPSARRSPLSFPRDFGAHPQSRLEWWYLSGLLFDGDAPIDAQSQPRYGFQLTFFRVRGPAAAEHPSNFAARQLMMAHAVLSDIGAASLSHDQRIARQFPGLAHASEQDCDVQMGAWFLRRKDSREGKDGTASHYAAAMQGSSHGRFDLALQLLALQPTLLQGEAGFSRKGPGAEQFSHYYSQVQLQGEARLKLEGRQSNLRALAWLDHEWSDQLLGAAEARSADKGVGWDWMGINLHDGAALTLFRLRRADGSTLWSGGSYRTASAGLVGEAQNFAPEQVSMQVLKTWRSPTSQAQYPVAWRLQTPVATFTLHALIEAQEIDARASTGMRYWEGPAELRNATGKRLGLGYLEMTGYAGAVKLA
ncbi:lipocalin-like domain-containing protein [Paucibacter sp. Y2R2-4]|uniref:lipocalin-like domain-containing protein n=1 Tax=Paucibacter sp. Y2R2-4 TaxID=2893553 RepID=UPI0021E4591C|nr:lipocalin-like domain-containing protein [Paucibacter sp. Y2R2-4]MCV2348248.1 carotenoid 1,2-hydratase [Paucibacter sp. Y2R2-4]